MGEITRTFLSRGAVVATFNFRGAGNSQGRTSWSANPETFDYLSVLISFVLYMQGLCRLVELLQETNADDNTAPINIVCAGYSYGSLVVSRMMSLLLDTGSNERKNAAPQPWDHSGPQTHHLEDISGLSAGSPHMTNSSEDFHIALHWMDQSLSPQPLRGKQIQSAFDKYLKEGFHRRMKTPRYRFLLVSPLLPPITWLLSCTSISNLWTKQQDNYHQLTQNPTLALFGDQDVFTSGRKLKCWGETLRKVPSSRFEFRSIPGVGHFWQESGATQALRESIHQWIV